MKRALLALLLIGAAGGALLFECPVPWSALFLALAGLLVLAAWSLRRETARIVLINLAAVFVAFAVFEGYLGLQTPQGDGTRMEGTITGNFVESDDQLGYRPIAGSQVTARKLFGDTIIYDVVYTIDENGRRVTSPPNQSPATRRAVFFGDSVTFGEGVNDAEAYPHVVASVGGGNVAVYNFAFSGYGPHQMLSALLAGQVDAVAGCGPVQFIHLAILEHIPRVAGLAHWDKHGPRFRLDDNGRPVRQGNFDSPTLLFGRWTAPQWGRQLLQRFHMWQNVFGRGRALNEKDLALYIGVVREAARELRQRYSHSTFDVLLWDGRDDTRLETIERSLRADQINVHRLTSVIPDLAENSDRYLLGPHDGHPNPIMHRLIGEYVAALLETGADDTASAQPEACGND